MAQTTTWKSNNPYTLRNSTTSSPLSSRPPQSTSDPSRTHLSPPSAHPTKPLRLYRLNGTPYEVHSRRRAQDGTTELCGEQDPPKYESATFYSDFRPLNIPPAVIEEIVEGRCECQTREPISSNGRPGEIDLNCPTCGKSRVTSSSPNLRRNDASFTKSASSQPTTILIGTSTATRGQTQLVHPRATCQKCGMIKQSMPSLISQQPPTSVAQQPSSVRPPTDSSQQRPVPDQTLLNRGTSNRIRSELTPPTGDSRDTHSSPLAAPGTDQISGTRSTPPTSKPQVRRTNTISSIASSIVRSISLSRHRRHGKTNTDRSVPNLSSNRDTRKNVRIFAMITNALRREPKDRSTLSASRDTPERSSSPFSFTEGLDEETIELDSMQKHRPEAHRSLEPVDMQTTEPVVSEQDPFADQNSIRRPDPGRTQSEPLQRVAPSLPVPDADTWPTLPERPTQLTRYHSLRIGVQRAGSVARSSSLKRLNSLKSVPQLWYRTDMAIEGATVSVY